MVIETSHIDGLVLLRLRGLLCSEKSSEHDESKSLFTNNESFDCSIKSDCLSFCSRITYPCHSVDDAHESSLSHPAVRTVDIFLFLKSCAEWDMEELRLEGEE